MTDHTAPWPTGSRWRDPVSDSQWVVTADNDLLCYRGGTGYGIRALASTDSVMGRRLVHEDTFAASYAYEVKQAVAARAIAEETLATTRGENTDLRQKLNEAEETVRELKADAHARGDLAKQLELCREYNTNREKFHAAEIAGTRQALTVAQDERRKALQEAAYRTQERDALVDELAEVRHRAHPSEELYAKLKLVTQERDELRTERDQLTHFINEAESAPTLTTDARHEGHLRVDGVMGSLICDICRWEPSVTYGRALSHMDAQRAVERPHRWPQP